jgi:hypothetical protein
MESCFTITFGDCAENHRGMQQIGEIATRGFKLSELKIVRDWFNEQGAETKIIHLNKALPDEISEIANNAYVLIIRKGLEFIDDEITADEFYEEQDKLEKDTKAKMYGRVCDKKARYNLCFADEDQEPDYENGKGRIYAFDNPDVPLLNILRNKLGEIFGEKGTNLFAEGNYYYDTTKCGIGFHGDSERKIVIAVRLGKSMPLHYQWFYRNKPVGDRIKLILNHGDIYVMSQKATGNDFKRSIIPTLRHAAGCKKFLTIK